KQGSILFEYVSGNRVQQLNLLTLSLLLDRIFNLISLFFGYSIIDMCSLKLVRLIAMRVHASLYTMFKCLLPIACLVYSIKQLAELQMDYATKTISIMNLQTDVALHKFSIAF